MNPGDDPWQTGGRDPWAGQRLPHQQAEEEEQQTSQPSGSAMPSTFVPGLRTRQSIIGVGVTPGSMDPPPQRVLHDVPPNWDGSKPDKELEPYVKLMKCWLATTRTLKTQQGLIMLQNSSGDLKLLINELDIEDLTAEDSGEKVLKHIQSAYAEYLEKKLPQAIEACFYDSNISRRKGESMLAYVMRRDTLFKKLAKEGWTVPDEAKAYLLLRDAHLPDKAKELIEMWTNGAYRYSEMQKLLKKLERPVPGSGHLRLTGLAGFLEGESSASAGEREDLTSSYAIVSKEPEETEITFMQESLFVLPDAFDEELLLEALPHLENQEIVYVAGDLDEGYLFDEDEAVAIFANYGQVRQYLHKKALGRGFFKPSTPGQGGKGSSGGKRPLAITNGPSSPPPPRAQFHRRNTARPKMWNKAAIIARTKCARCGKVGHWARSCTNPPDERGKQRAKMATQGFVATSTTGASSSFTFTIFTLSALSGNFLVGVLLVAGFGLVDTGAQHGVIGLPDFEEFCKALSRFGLKPRELPTFDVQAVGVGGATSFLKSVEAPIALQGACGTLTLNVIKDRLPLLIPAGFCKGLGLVLDCEAETATWKNLGGRVSKVHNLPSEHMAINLLEFPPTGWTNPHANKVSLGNGANPEIPRSEFELPNGGSTTTQQSGILNFDGAVLPKQDSLVGSSHNNCCGVDEHVGTSMSYSDSQHIECCSRFGTNSTLQVDRDTESVPLEKSLDQSHVGVADSVPNYEVSNASGKGSVSTTLPNCPAGGQHSQSPISLSAGTSDWQGITQGHGTSRSEECHDGSSHVSASS